MRNRLINTFILIDKFRFNVADFLNWCSNDDYKKVCKNNFISSAKIMEKIMELVNVMLLNRHFR